ncbi:MAG: hypothetical protein IKA17_08055 [Clostridia bacterium]|nr:hypothetical protein [Clostridia bacterium]
MFNSTDPFDTEKGYQYDLENEINSVVSQTECTGLIQVPPQDEDEAESYTEIYTVPKNDKPFNK